MDKEQSEGVRKIQSSFDGGDVVLRGKVPSRKYRLLSHLVYRNCRRGVNCDGASPRPKLNPSTSRRVVVGRGYNEIA